MPDQLSSLSTREFGRRFFAEICLETPEMGGIKRLVEAEQFDEALEAWADKLLQRIQKVFLAKDYNLSNFEYDGQFPIDRLMDKERIQLGYRLGQATTTVDLGALGAQSSVCSTGLAAGFNPALLWHRPDQWSPGGLNINIMWHPKFLLREADRINRGLQSPYQLDALLKRWRDVWRDFASNNWRCGLRLAQDRNLRLQVLSRFGVKSAPSEWGGRLLFEQQLYLSWLLESYLYQVTYAVLNLYAETRRTVTARVQAELAYFIVTWPFQNAMAMDPRLPGVTNQWLTRLHSVLGIRLLLPEFTRTHPTEGYVETGLGCATGRMPADCYIIDTHPDGSGSENSFNYMAGATGSYRKINERLALLNTQSPVLSHLEATIDLREKFQSDWITPNGNLILGNNSVEPRYQQGTKSASSRRYTSIAFPYHGLYIMRSGWDREALHLALHSPRRGHGHEAEDAAKIVIEAFGRQLLVANPGTTGLMGTSWAQNTIVVDNLSQARTAWARHGAYSTPQRGRWSTSDHFDVAEVTYQYGYGRISPSPKHGPPVRVSDVRHLRQVIFIKAASLWVFVDVLNAPPRNIHSYSQIWHFDTRFPKEAVLVNDSEQTVRTADPGRPNLFLIHAGRRVSYATFFGHGWHTPTLLDTQDALKNIPELARGWQNTNGGYSARGVRSAVDVHATWSGEGTQILITAAIPSRTPHNPIQTVERPTHSIGAELRLTLPRDLKLSVKAREDNRVPGGIATHVALKSGALERGVVLGEKSAHHLHINYEYSRGSSFSLEKIIGSPSGFAWRDTPFGPTPDYYPMP